MQIGQSDAKAHATLRGETDLSRVGLRDVPRAAGKVNWALPGFFGKTRIRTTFGELPVEALRVNDPILTTKRGVVRVQRINRIGMDRDFLFRHAEAQPIKILAGAFGRGLPLQDLLVSPGQVIEIPTGFGVMRPIEAGQIKGFNTVSREFHNLLTYHILELTEPAFIFAEGIPVSIPLRVSMPLDDAESED